jgi:ribosomal protein S27AE
MSMDIDALHSALLSIIVVSEKIRSARETLPTTGDTWPGLGRFLYEVESDLRIAKATLAGELGFSLCPRCWPPELVATDLDGRVNCPSCGQVSYEEAA